jgi:hypothetical protein
MSSITGIVSVHGSRFDSGVVHAGEAVERPVNEELKLPGGSRVSLLAELPRAKDPADLEELKVLMSEAYALDERIKQFATARFAEQRADREADLERAKLAVREQQGVLRNLMEKLARDNQEFVRLDNRRALAQRAGYDAEAAARSLSPFASRQEKLLAEKHLQVANQKAQAAVVAAGEFGTQLNTFKSTVIPRENKKLEDLAGTVVELSAQLEGRDPVLARFGFTQR